MRLVNQRLRWLRGSAWALALIVLIVLFPSVAFAAGEQTALQNATDQILAILIPVFVTAIGAIATALLMKLKSKLHLDVSDKTAEAWTQLAEKAALRGAEWARQKIKTLEDDKKLPGGEVMDVAVNWALQMAEQQKLPAMAREKLQGLIESQLFKLRQQEATSTMAATSIGPIPRI